MRSKPLDHDNHDRGYRYKNNGCQYKSFHGIVEKKGGMWSDTPGTTDDWGSWSLYVDDLSDLDSFDKSESNNYIKINL
jgi:hypothetical protein